MTGYRSFIYSLGVCDSKVQIHEQSKQLLALIKPFALKNFSRAELPSITHYLQYVHVYVARILRVLV